MSCLEQLSLATGAAALVMSLSMVSSVQCCMVTSGIDDAPVLTTFISHKPALRTGKSSATAPCAASAQHDKPNDSSSRFMARSNSDTTTNMGEEIWRQYSV